MKKVAKINPDIRTLDKKFLFKSKAFLSDFKKTLVGYTIPSSYE